MSAARIFYVYTHRCRSESSRLLLLSKAPHKDQQMKDNYGDKFENRDDDNPFKLPPCHIANPRLSTEGSRCPPGVNPRTLVPKTPKAVQDLKSRAVGKAFYAGLATNASGKTYGSLSRSALARKRIASPCAHPGCKRMTTPSTSGLLCRWHQERVSRHGHPERLSLLPAAVRPWGDFVTLVLKRTDRYSIFLAEVRGAMRIMLDLSKTPGQLYPSCKVIRREQWPQDRIDALAARLIGALLLCRHLGFLNDARYCAVQLGKLAYRKVTYGKHVPARAKRGPLRAEGAEFYDRLKSVTVAIDEAAAITAAERPSAQRGALWPIEALRAAMRDASGDDTDYDGAPVEVPQPTATPTPTPTAAPSTDPDRIRANLARLRGGTNEESKSCE